MYSDRPRAALLRVFTVLAAVLAVVLTAVTPAAASHPSGPKPTIVLVLMGGVWRVPAGERAERVLDLVVEGLRAR